MSKRKDLKKNINYICGELFAECVALSRYKINVKHEDVDNVMMRILLMQDEFINRISHTQPQNAAAYYKKLRNDFNAQVEDIITIISQLN